MIDHAKTLRTQQQEMRDLLREYRRLKLEQFFVTLPYKLPLAVATFFFGLLVGMGVQI